MSNHSSIENDWETFFQKGEDMMMIYDLNNKTSHKHDVFKNTIETNVNKKMSVSSATSMENANHQNLPLNTNTIRVPMKCGPLYISTKTVIGYINVTKMIDLWNYSGKFL